MWDHSQMRAMPKGWIGAAGGNDLTLLAPVCLCTLARRASDGRNTERTTLLRCYQPPMHPFHCKGPCTSWLLPETIRSPSAPSTMLLSMSSPSPNTTAVLCQRKVMNQNPILFSFARSGLLSQIWISHKIWGGGLIDDLFWVTLH